MSFFISGAAAAANVDRLQSYIVTAGPDSTRIGYSRSNAAGSIDPDLPMNGQQLQSMLSDRVNDIWYLELTGTGIADTDDTFVSIDVELEGDQQNFVRSAATYFPDILGNTRWQWPAVDANAWLTGNDYDVDFNL